MCCMNRNKQLFYYTTNTVESQSYQLSHYNSLNSNTFREPTCLLALWSTPLVTLLQKQHMYTYCKHCIDWKNYGEARILKSQCTLVVHLSCFVMTSQLTNDLVIFYMIFHSHANVVDLNSHVFELSKSATDRTHPLYGNSMCSSMRD